LLSLIFEPTSQKNVKFFAKFPIFSNFSLDIIPTLLVK
jgi:hypothetical protein